MKKIKELFFSYRTMGILLVLYMILLAVATFVEAKYDTPTAKKIFYNSLWFILLQLIMVVNFVGISIRQKLLSQKKWGTLMLHWGFVVILLGALVTHITSKEGILHIREGEESSVMIADTPYLSFALRGEETREHFDYPLVLSKGAKSRFKIVKEINGNPMTIELKDYCIGCGENNYDKLNLEITYKGKTQKVDVEGAKFVVAPSSVVSFDGFEMLFRYASAYEELPFTIKLNDFIIERYPGSSAPSSYESKVDIMYNGKTEKKDIFMNNIAYVGPYRIYQSSYDPDGKGTILTVNKDLVGTVISYIGYLMMAIGMVLALFHKNSRFRSLSRKLRKLSQATIFLLMVASPFISSAFEYTSADVLKRGVISKESADSLATVLVQNPNGRVEPFSTYSSKLLRKLNRSNNFHSMSPEQVLIGMVSDPYSWSSTPLLYVSNKEVVEKLGLGGKYVAYNELFNEKGEYKLLDMLNTAHMKNPKDQSRFEKDILKLDEKVNIANSIFTLTNLPLFPLEGSPNDKWYSAGDNLSEFNGRDSLFVSKIFDWYIGENQNSIKSGNWKTPIDIIGMIKTYQNAKASDEHIIPTSNINWEIFYNKANIFKTTGLGYLSLGFILMMLLFVSLLKGDTIRFITLSKVLIAAICVVFLWHTFGIGLRWYISGRAPWTNSYESMVYVSWSAVLLGVLFSRRSSITVAIATILGGLILMISQLNWMDPEITPLVPVLKSYWLMFHVAIITASYGFFGVSALLGLMTLFAMIFSNKERLTTKIDEMNIINEMSMIIGTILLAIGIFIGAVWANESWGRYWGWDPKETWALITMIVYAFITHIRFIPAMRSSYIFAIMSVFGFYSVLMTFFGVNYYLSGMHSYGSGQSFSSTIFIIVTAVLVGIAAMAGREKDKTA